MIKINYYTSFYVFHASTHLGSAHISALIIVVHILLLLLFVLHLFTDENAHSGAFSSVKSNGSMRIENAQRSKKGIPQGVRGSDRDESDYALPNE